MQEQRPPQASNLAAFKDGWDEYDFAKLVSEDPMWSVLYDDKVNSVADLLAEERRQLALEVVAAPNFSEHLIGYVYYREAAVMPPSMGSILNRLTPYAFDNVPPDVARAVHHKINGLLSDQTLERASLYSGQFCAGPQFPRDQLPELEGFEERAQRFIQSCGGEALNRIVVLECIDEPREPFHFWAGVRKVFEMRQEGLLARSGAYVSLQQEASIPEEPVDIDGENLEEKLRRLHMGMQRFKPRQRDRDPRRR